MTLAVSQETRATTTKCQRGFECLECQSECLCRVVDYYVGRVCFVEGPADPDCPYFEQWGLFTERCSCPTRIAVYNQYRV